MAGEIPVAKDGAAACAVVVAEPASLPERHAAGELARFLTEITGAEIPLVHSPQGDSPNLLVGETAAKHADPDFSKNGLGADELVLRTVGNDLILAGGELRGTLYAVYTFLEDVAGCRWWAPDASRIPKIPNLSFGPLDKCYAPPYEHRDVLIMPMAADPDWSVRNRCVGELHGYGKFDMMPERGGCRKA